MLERRDYRVILGVRSADVWPKVWDWWTTAGFAVVAMGQKYTARARRTAPASASAWRSRCGSVL